LSTIRRFGDRHNDIEHKKDKHAQIQIVANKVGDLHPRVPHQFQEQGIWQYQFRQPPSIPTPGKHGSGVIHLNKATSSGHNQIKAGLIPANRGQIEETHPKDGFEEDGLVMEEKARGPKPHGQGSIINHPMGHQEEPHLNPQHKKSGKGKIRS